MGAVSVGKTLAEYKKGRPLPVLPRMGRPPFQFSPESDLDFHVEPNELHIMVCLGRP